MTKAEARQQLHQRIERETAHGPRATEDVTFGWFALNRYLPLRAGSLKPSSAKHLGWFIEVKMVPRWGKTPIGKMDRFSMQTWLNGLAEEGYSHSLVHKARTYLNSILDEAFEEDLIPKNTARRLDLPRMSPINRRSLSPEDCAKLSAAQSGRDRLIFLLLIEAGLRPGEIFALCWDDCEPDILRIDERVYGGALDTPKTEGSIAHMMIPQRIDGMIRQYRPRPRWPGTSCFRPAVAKRRWTPRIGCTAAFGPWPKRWSLPG